MDVCDSYRDSGVGRHAAEGFSMYMVTSCRRKSFKREQSDNGDTSMIRREDVVTILQPTAKLRDFDKIMRLRKRRTDKPVSTELAAKEKVERLGVDEKATSTQAAKLNGSSTKEAIHSTAETPSYVAPTLPNKPSTAESRVACKPSPPGTSETFEDTMTLRRRHTDPVISKKRTVGNDTGVAEATEGLRVINILPRVNTSARRDGNCTGIVKERIAVFNSPSATLTTTKTTTTEDTRRSETFHTNFIATSYIDDCEDGITAETPSRQAEGEGQHNDNSGKHVIKEGASTSRPQKARLQSFDDVMRVRRCHTDTAIYITANFRDDKGAVKAGEEQLIGDLHRVTSSDGDDRCKQTEREGVVRSLPPSNMMKDSEDVTGPQEHHTDTVTPNISSLNDDTVERETMNKPEDEYTQGVGSDCGQTIEVEDRRTTPPHQRTRLRSFDEVMKLRRRRTDDAISDAIKYGNNMDEVKATEEANKLRQVEYSRIAENGYKQATLNRADMPSSIPTEDRKECDTNTISSDTVGLDDDDRVAAKATHKHSHVGYPLIVDSSSNKIMKDTAATSIPQAGINSFADVMRLWRRRTEVSISDATSACDDGDNRMKVEGLQVNEALEGKHSESSNEKALTKIKRWETPTPDATSVDDVMKSNSLNEATPATSIADEEEKEVVTKFPTDKTIPFTCTPEVNTDKQTISKTTEEETLSTTVTATSDRSKHVGNGDGEEIVELLAVSEAARASCPQSVAHSIKQVISWRTGTSKPVKAKLTNFDDIMRIRRHRTDTSLVVGSRKSSSEGVGRHTVESLSVDATTHEVIDETNEAAKRAAGSLWMRHGRKVPSG